MSEYTPTTREVRETWGAFSGYGGVALRPSGSGKFWPNRLAEFDRWLQQIRAEAPEPAPDLSNPYRAKAATRD